MNRVLFFSLLLTCGAALVPAQTAFEPLAAKIRTQALPLPAETPVVSLTPWDKDNPRQSYVIQRTFAADGTFTVAWTSTRHEAVQKFRPDGTLWTSVQTDLSKATKVATESDGARTTVQTVVTEKGRVKTDKRSELKPGIVLRDELSHLIIQAWSYGIRDGLKFQSLSPDGGLVGDFLILFKTVGDPTKLATQYSFPAEFKEALTGRSYLVADMALQGVGAFFYPHHFYQIFTVTPAGLRFVAYFGEDPKKAVFQFVPGISP